MEEITITAKIQIITSNDNTELLNATMSAYTDACNYVSNYVFQTHNLKQFALNKLLYSDLKFFATFKCACALAINNYGMGNDHYLANDIGMHFANSAKLSNGVYSDEGFIYRLLTIMKNTSIDWEDLRDTFLAFDNVTSTNKLEKFQMFIDILSKNSGVDIKTQFTEKEWETLISKYKNNN